MNLFADFEQRIRAALAAVRSVPTASAARDALARITAEPPRDPGHGDVATNAAMVLAKPLGAKPRDLADAARGASARRPGRRDASRSPGPGFVNLRLTDAFWAAQLRGHSGRRHRATASPAVGAAARPSTSNTSRPTRPGRCMSAIAAARSSATPSPTCSPATGYAVTREYYINDAGAQVDVARPLRLPPLPRGARRGRSAQIPERPLSGRLPEAGRATRSPTEFGDALLATGGGRVAAARPRPRDRRR